MPSPPCSKIVSGIPLALSEISSFELCFRSLPGSALPLLPTQPAGKVFPSRAELLPPTHRRCNNYELTKLGAYLCRRSSANEEQTLNTEISLDREAAIYLQTVLANRQFSFARLPQESVLPYLELKELSPLTLEKAVTPLEKNEPGFQNLLFLAERGYQAYLQNSNLVNSVLAYFASHVFGASSRYQTSSFAIEYCDGLPYLELSFFSQAREILVLRLPPYAVEGAMLVNCIKSVYGLTCQAYLSFYRNMTPAICTALAYVLHREGSASALQYHPTSRLGSLLEVVNLPFLVSKLHLFQSQGLEYNLETMKNYLNRISFPPLSRGCARLGLAAEARILRTLSADNEFLSLASQTMLARTELSLNQLPEVLDENAFWKGASSSLRSLYRLLPSFAASSAILRFSPEQIFDNPRWSVADLSLYLSSRGTSMPLLASRELAYIYFYLVTSISDHTLPALTKGVTFNGAPAKLLTALTDRYTRFLSLRGSIPFEESELFVPLAKFLSLRDWVLYFPTLLQILERGYIYPLPLSELHLKRARAWRLLSTMKKELMRILYDNSRMTESGYVLVTPRLASCEQLIFDFRADMTRTELLALGMLLPYSMTPLEYFSISLPHYRELSARGSGWLPKLEVASIPQMCDTELLELVLGGYTGARDRNELQKHAKRVLRGEDMLLLVKAPLTKDSLQLGRSELFPYCSYPPSTNPLNLLLLYRGRGQNSQFTLTELDIFNRELYIPNEDGTTTIKQDLFRVPLLKADVFTGEGVVASTECLAIFESLLHYCRAYLNEIREDFVKLGWLEEVESSADEDTACEIAKLNLEAVDNLLTRVEKVRLRNKANTSLELKIVNAFLSLTTEARSMLVEGLILFFEAGMIQRQWNGVRGVYPHTERETKREEEFKDKDLRVNDQLMLLYQHFDKLNALSPAADKLLESLPLMTLSNDRSVASFFTEENRGRSGIRTLRQLYNDVAVGEAKRGLCIRTASGKFISSAYYWLHLFGHSDKLGKFEILKLEYFG